MKRNPIATIAFLMLSISMARPSHAESGSTTFHNAANGYTLSVPAGWVQIPDEENQRYRAAILKSPNAGTQVDAAFQRQDRPGWFYYPYTIVSVFPYPSGEPNASDLTAMVTSAAGLDANAIANDTFSQEGRQAMLGGSFGQPQWDERNKTLRLSIRMNVANVGVVNGYGGMHCGRYAMVLVWCYTAEADADANADAPFATINNSFQFDEGKTYDERLAYTPSKSARVSDAAWEGGLKGFVVEAWYGVLAAIGAAWRSITLWFRKRPESSATAA